MIQPTQPVLESIAVLIYNNDFKKIVAWIRESEAIITKNNITVADELQLRWNQGKLQNMNDILRAVDEVLILLEAYRQYTPSGTNPDI
jgi:hypothetical protein